MPSHTEEARKKNRERIDKLREEGKVGKGDKVAGRKFIQEREKRASKLATGEVPTKRDFEQATREAEAADLGETERTVEDVKGEEQKFVDIAEEQRVFEEPTVERIISPEQENLGVIGRILGDIASNSVTDFLTDNLKSISGMVELEKGEPIPQAEITTIESDLVNAIETETSAEIDLRIEETEQQIVQLGFPVAGLIGTAIVAGAISQPVSEFVGTDGQISSLELALSQYNEMITIPSRSVDSGLSPQLAFDKLNRMEDGILSLESQLKLSALTSPKVALSLRGRGVEARLLKLKEKLQEGRRTILFKSIQEGFGERDIPESVSFLRRLQNDRTTKGGE